jgi:hypothetical protein
MRCIDKNSNEIDLNQWEILGRMPYKEDVDILYLRNKWRKPDEEQIFLVGYQNKESDENAMEHISINNQT